MINLNVDNKLTKWFVWSCDYLPLTVTHIYDEDGNDCGRRDGASYLANGTTLCHIFWAILWVPILGAGLISFLVCMVVILHFAAHEHFIRYHPDAGPIADIMSYFLPEAFLISIAVLAGLTIFAIIGGSKSGFFILLWQYLKGIKQQICPLVKFIKL